MLEQILNPFSVPVLSSLWNQSSLGVTIYGMSDPGRSHCGWETVAGKGQTDTPCRESLGMESLFSGCWEGIRVGKVWG